MIPQPDEDDPPPSYAEATAGANRTDPPSTRRHSTSSTPVRLVISHGGPARRMFPQAFNVYADSECHYVLGESRSQPLYAISTHWPPSLKPDLMIHSGVSLRKPIIAAVNHGVYSRSATIKLPPRPGSRLVAATERLDPVGAFTRVMSFSIETALSGGAREHFEWRHSSGVEVEALGGRHSGWKLVRVSPPPIITHGPARKHSNALGHSSDGREVVAVWSGAMLFMNKVLRFRFLGVGADGSLGERWAVMAVASALAIWNHERRPRNRGLSAMSAGF